MSTTTPNLMTAITAQYDNMTNAEKKVADFVLNSPQAALSSTITDLARLCGVGETSVFRFCKTLNFNGYQEFRISLALSSSAPSVGTDVSDLSPNEEDLAHQVMSIYSAAVQKAYSSLDYPAIDQAVSLLLKADFVYFFGAGGSALSAAEMHWKFSKIMPNIAFDADLHQQLLKASLLKAGCVSVIYCNSGTTKDSITLAQLSHERGAKVIFITSFSDTPAAEYSDVVLLSGAAEGPFAGGSITAKTSQLFMMDILYAKIFQAMGKDAEDNKMLTASAIANKML